MVTATGAVASKSGSTGRSSECLGIGGSRALPAARPDRSRVRQEDEDPAGGVVIGEKAFDA